MEIPVIAGILGVGYYLNKNKEIVKNTSEPKNIYESKRALKIRQEELIHARNNYDNAREENRIFPGPPKIDPTLLFNKVDYSENSLPVEFRDLDSTNAMFSDTKIDVNYVPNNGDEGLYKNEFPYSGGEHGISLTGEPIIASKFLHNNMVPFFGGRVKQNSDDKVNATLLENFTGNIENYQNKKELGVFFQAENNVSNPYGAASTTQFMQDRVIPSKIMNNVSPVEQVRVGPGINQGYTAEPSGGYQQANARDYVLPKTVDELRAKNNPKLTFNGRILSGNGISQRGILGKVEKRNPESFYVNTPDRYFTTVGAVVADALRPNIILRDGNRKTQGRKTRIGPAKSQYGNKDAPRPKFQKSSKVQFKSDGMRHLNAQGRWQICEEESEENAAKQALHDYGKSRTVARDTERQTMSNTEYRGTLKGGIATGARNEQRARLTKKRHTSKNNRAGNMTGNRLVGPVCNPDDKMRTTIKEQMVDNTHSGFVNPEEKKAYVLDPHDTARTTVKETTGENNHMGSVQVSDKKMLCRDPNDIAKRTVKETTLLEDVVGTMYKALGVGYTVAKNEMRNTIRQFTSDTDYSGIAGATTNQKPVSYEQMYNSTVRSLREQVSRGRSPTNSGAKKMNHNVNMTTRRVGDIQNKYINERGLAPTKVYNSIQQTNPCGITKEKTRVSNDDINTRFDPELLLDQLKTNPYSLRSLAV